ncbi:hypothetical protein [Gallaecimonas mangrovi]|uniref:hypothetical protein n=1 Tax=Gallaecimonas mangrovi TaxID=2291597 RepID=UPI000E207793|nr:hypothetical protein [Gallaecimonas mangrovi]
MTANIARAFYLLAALDALLLLGRMLVGQTPAPVLFTSALMLVALVLFRMRQPKSRLMVAVMAVVTLSQGSQLVAALTGYAHDPYFMFTNLGVMIAAVICAKVAFRKSSGALSRD